MSAPSVLKLQIGFATRKGDRPANEDFVDYVVKPSLDTERRGQVLAIADGMGGTRGGRTAAELAVGGFIDGYYSLPETQSVQHAAAQAIGGVNAWLHAQGSADPALRHAATTFTALVFRRRTVHVLHIGDTRAYRLSDGQLTRLTSDHAHGPVDLAHILYRAVGLEASIRLDHDAHALRLHDRFLLCSDGVHGSLGDRRLREVLQRRSSPAEDALHIVNSALAAGGADNATAVIADVVAVPELDPAELSGLLAELPIAPLPAPGDLIDGFHLFETLSDSRYTRLYVAVDTVTDRRVVLKFPQPSIASAATYHLAFIREVWVAARVHSLYLVDLIELSQGRQTRLYSVMPYYEGPTLEQRLHQQPPLAAREGLEIAIKLSKAITALHRAGIIHRDIKPDNVILEPGGGVKLLDLGVVRLPHVEEFPSGDIPGTPSYMAPELFAAELGNEATDQFALGVTLYRALTAHYPYGEIEPFTHPKFGQPVPLSRYRPDLPAWVDHVIGRAVAVNPAHRYGDVLEFSSELERASARGIPVIRARRSLYERNPLKFWQIVSLLLLIALIWSLAR